jgi:pimeloyl-ACP methyl ester carboxylesterase
MQQTKSPPRGRFVLAAGSAAMLAGLALLNAARARQAVRHHPPVGSFTEVDGVRLHYVERGTGPVILLLHGNGVMLDDWIISGTLDDLARTNRVIAVDRPGYGHSSRPRGIRWTPERQAHLIARFMEQLGVMQAKVVGHSLGASTAAALALNHPQLVSSLVVLGGYYYPTARPDVLLMVPSATPGLGDVLTRTTMPLMAEALQPATNRGIFGPAETPDRWRREFSWAMALRPTRMRAGAADAVHLVPAAARLARRYPELKMPVAILAGRGDRVVKASQAERLHRALPHSRLTLIDGSGHMVHHSATERVVAAIRQQG